MGDAEASWFASVIHRLHELSKEKVSRFESDPAFQSAVRYHPVDWDATAIPISRADLSWLPPTILENDAEFPIVQFHVSKAVGRVHGFWDQEWCFQIVLLDPMHNLQPSKDLGYRIRPTSIAGCKFTAFCVAVDRVRSKPCSDEKCDLARALTDVVPEAVAGQVAIVAGITPDVAEELQKLRERRVVSISEIMEHGITFWNEEN